MLQIIPYLHFHVMTFSGEHREWEFTDMKNTSTNVIRVDMLAILPYDVSMLEQKLY